MGEKFDLLSIFNKPNDSFEKCLKELVAVLFWTYSIIKLFIFDIDSLILIKLAPKYITILNYKFLILIGLIAVLWAFTNTKKIFGWIFYIIIYPVILLFWKIPRLIFKKGGWTLSFAYVNSVISFFSSIKYSFIISTSFIISLVIIICSLNRVLLQLSIIAIFTLLVLVYINRIILVIKPSKTFKIYIDFFARVNRNNFSNFAIDEQMKSLPIEQLDAAQRQKRTSNLQTLVFMNRICFFIAKKLENYQSSGINIISDVVSMLLLVFVTTAAFTGLNYGIYKLNNYNFQITTTPTFFLFFYYSFKQFVFSSIIEILPIGKVAQILSIIESIFSLFFISIFITLILTIRGQRYAEELKKVIKEISNNGKVMESFIKDEYELDNIHAAIIELEKLKAVFVGTIYKISNYIDDTSSD